jgi:hypothetical protein
MENPDRQDDRQHVGGDEQRRRGSHEVVPAGKGCVSAWRAAEPGSGQHVAYETASAVTVGETDSALDR